MCNRNRIHYKLFCLEFQEVSKNKKKGTAEAMPSLLRKQFVSNDHCIFRFKIITHQTTKSACFPSLVKCNIF